jgi:hypothetical protein
MNKLLLSLSSVLLLSNAQVNAQNYEFEMVELDLESQICVLAAEKGMKAAKNLAIKNGVYLSSYSNDFYCNTKKLNDFVKQYGKANKNLTLTGTSETKLYAADENIESDLCVKAVELGLEAVKAMHKNVDSVRCNGRSIKQFVNKFSNKTEA